MSIAASGASDWPPSPADLYIPRDPIRPVFQGDIFDDVPFVKARSAGRVDLDPNVAIERRMIAVIGYPCDVYDGGRLVKVQAIAPVVDAAKRGIPTSWDGAFNLFPLPDLRGDGHMYAVDFRATSNVDASYLARENRLVSLSQTGWGLFRLRLVLSLTRVVVSASVWDTTGQALWKEFDLWTQWCTAGANEETFQTWLDEPCAHLGGFTRRSLLHRGQHDQVERDLVGALSGLTTHGPGLTS